MNCIGTIKHLYDFKCYCSSILLNLSLFILLCILSGCVAPIYNDTAYGIDEFIADSAQIAQGKFAILELEEKNVVSHVEPRTVNDALVIDGDELTITLHCPTRQDRVFEMEAINEQIGFPVNNGVVCLPHLAPIDISDSTLSEVSCRIQEAYNQDISDAKVYVDFKKRRERIVQIIGAKVPNVFVDGSTRLSEVIARARISPYANLFKSYVMRDGEQMPIDLYQLIHEGDESQNIVMQGGDKIFIANGADASVMVTGEVAYPLVIPVPYGFVSLREALSRVGGIPFTGSKNSIQVIRGGLTHPKIYCLDWSELLRTSNKSLLLIPGDIVVVSEKPITQWNRFIDQLQPSSGCMQTGYAIYETMRLAR